MFEVNDKNDAFNVAIGLYTWLSHNYSGMYCDKYAAMSKLVGEHNLSIRGDELEDEEQLIYDELSEENWAICWETLDDYLTNKWNHED